jgi:hypothetical protein
MAAGTTIISQSLFIKYFAFMEHCDGTDQSLPSTDRIALNPRQIEFFQEKTSSRLRPHFDDKTVRTVKART